MVDVKLNQKPVILAVSGGVDSVVMADMYAAESVAIAHFNHGIRVDASEDEGLVRKLAEKHGLKFEVGRADLGEGASEETARVARWMFLNSVAEKYVGVVATAHHKEDVVESVAINLARGTGWRGLVPMDARGVLRPLISWTKPEIYNYAREKHLTWREDSTNGSAAYLRNRIRQKLAGEANAIDKVFALYERQRDLKVAIEKTDRDILTAERQERGIYAREFFARLGEPVALELLRAALQGIGKSATRPQLSRLLEAIRTFEPGKRLNLLKDYFVRFDKNHFYL